MRVFPFMDGDRIIELVERRELDAAQAEIARLTALWVRPNAANSADNMRTCATCSNDLVCHDLGKCQQPTPDYGEPWIVGRIDRPMEDRHKHDPLMLHRTTSRAVSCVNACKGMADPAVEIQAMKAALKKLKPLITDNNSNIKLTAAKKKAG